MVENTLATFSQCGQPEQVLKLNPVPVREPKAGEILVRMLAAPINPADINFIQGVYGLKPVFPDSPVGMEGCGLVEGTRSPAFLPGDQVILLHGIGTWAKYLTASADLFMKLKVPVDPTQAAMLKINPPTAYRLLTGYRELQTGDWLVQNAANSGVGRCVMQMARLMGFKTINLVRRADRWAEELRTLGADVVVGEDDPRAVHQVLAALGGTKPLLGLNAVGGESAIRLMEVLGAGGTLVTYGAMSKQSLKVPNRFLIFKGLELKGLWITAWLKQQSQEDIEQLYDRLAGWMANGTLHQAIDSNYPLAQVTAAVTRAQEEYRNGKVMLRLDQ
ncbi:MAG: 2-enoyl thioester reductase domain-containing protein [Chromatiaceae bacterium]